MGNIIDAAKRFFSDGFSNVVTALGTSSDSSAYGNWFMREYSQAEIEASFRTSWASKKAHTIPVTDTVRPWRFWKATPEQIKAIEAEERRLGLRQKVRKALLWSRLYGGAIIVMGVTGDDMAQPLDIKRVKQGGLGYLHVMSRHEVTVEGVSMDPGSAQYQEPLAYVVNAAGQQTRIDPSRVVRFVPSDLPDTVTQSLGSWGDPLLVSMRNALANADSAQGHFAALIAKARSGTLKIPGLLDIVSTTEGEQALIRRTQVTQAYESMFNLRLISAPSRAGETGEDLTFEQVNWAGIADTGNWFLQLVAAASDVPITRFLSTSPGGLNSTGLSDSANYYEKLDADRELDLRPRLEMIDEVLIRSATGARDPEIWFEFGAFEVDSDTVKADNSLKRAQAIKTLAESGTVPGEVLAKGTRGQLTDSGDYPGIEEAYAEYEAAGNVLEIEEPEPAANDNLVAAATEGLVAQGMSARDAVRGAIALCDATPRTLYVSRSLINRDDVISYYAEKGVKVTVPPEKMHVTIAYSKQPVDWMKVSPDDWRDTELIVKKGGPRLHEKLGVNQEAVVLMFANSQLSWRHEEILRAGASWDWDEYQPHLTLNYDGSSVDMTCIEPYQGELRFAYERFAEVDEDWKDKLDE